LRSLAEEPAQRGGAPLGGLAILPDQRVPELASGYGIDLVLDHPPDRHDASTLGRRREVEVEGVGPPLAVHELVHHADERMNEILRLEALQPVAVRENLATLVDRA